MSDQNHTTTVEYRTIARFPGYRFGDDGSAWSCWNRTSLSKWGGTKVFLGTEWKRLTGRFDRNGYIQVKLKTLDSGKRVQYRLHRLVLEAFVGSCPEGMECRHLDGNPDNNRLNNLEWGTPAVNSADRKRHGTLAAGSKVGTSKLTEEQVIEIRKRVADGATGPELAQVYGVHEGTITGVAYGRRWMGIPGSCPVPRPSVRRPTAKLKPSQVVEIRRLHQGGMKQKEIAAKYGITCPSVSGICSGKSWNSPDLYPPSDSASIEG